MRLFAGALLLVLTACWLLPAQSSSRRAPDGKPEPATSTPASEPSEKLTYAVEWRLIHAGIAMFESHKAEASLKLESAGLVSTLFRVNDNYHVSFDEPFCASSSVMDSIEGKRHHETRATFDRAQGRASFVERDVIKNSVIRTTETEVPACVQEVLTALLKLRRQALSVGQSVQISMSDGRRAAPVKIEALSRETVKTPAGSYDAIQCEVFLMNGVVYTRKGRVLIWISNDERRLPVQIRLKMAFPVGTVTLQLQKEERT